MRKGKGKQSHKAPREEVLVPLDVANGKILLTICTLSGQTCIVEAPEDETASFAISFAINHLRLPNLGQAAYSLMIENDILHGHVPFRAKADLFKTGAALGTILRRQGPNMTIRVTFPVPDRSGLLSVGINTIRVDGTSVPTILALREFLAASEGIDVTKCTVAPTTDEEQSLCDMCAGPGRELAFAFVGEASVDTQMHATWIERQLPNGEKVWDVDLTALATSSDQPERSSDAIGSFEPSNQPGYGQGKGVSLKGGKGVPPLPSKGKGKAKGALSAPATRIKSIDEKWTPVLRPGANVMTKLNPDEAMIEDNLKVKFYALTGNRLYSYVEKEGSVLGWDETSGMWAVRMLCGSIWFTNVHHLNIRDPHASKWVQACDAPPDARPAAPAFSRAQTFELSRTIETIVRELSETI